MKKVLMFLVIVVAIVAIIGIKYSSYKIEYNAVKQENAEYELLKDKEIYGLDIATIMNKAVDKNTKNKIEKDENGMYIPNDKNSIKVQVYIHDNETTYNMETFYNAGTEQFAKYYGNIKFKCSKIEYHKKTGKIKYIYFEQLQTS